jgi:hypothetical protein
MNEKQKFFTLIGIISVIAFVVIGLATDDWIQILTRNKEGWYHYNEFDGIAWHSVIPFLIAVGSGIGWFLYKDNSN